MEDKNDWKIKKKISLIIFLAISIPLIIILVFYTISYRNNIIKTNTNIVDKIFGEPKYIPNGNKNDNYYDIDGITTISIINNDIYKTNGEISNKIKKYALKISNKKTETGIINNYIYKKRYLM